MNAHKFFRWMWACGAVCLVMQIASTMAQEARLFRIAGPVPTTIIDITSDGMVTWTNSPTNATFTIQTAGPLVASNWVDWVQVPASNATTLLRIFDLNPPPNMALIPAGVFTMGDSADGIASAIPVHRVLVSAFYMDRYEVTKALWDDIEGWSETNGYEFAMGAGVGKATNHPVHTVSWFDAVKWCNARSQKAGLVPCYYADAELTSVYKTGQLWPYVNWDAKGYRLPTEAEWEKAARGGTGEKRFPWSDADTIQHSRANYISSSSYAPDTSPTRGYHPVFDTSFPYTCPVTSFAPNGYGLYNLAGNVSEWCWDWLESYSGDPQTNPHGPAIGSDRVARGGNWGQNAFFCRVGGRPAHGPSAVDERIGLRCVRSSD